MKLRLYHITLFAALLLEGCAAYFSIYGLSYLFSGARIQIIIMAAGMELAKIIVVTFMYNWKTHTPKPMRFVSWFVVIFLMLLTSTGIYGYLSSAYQSVAQNFDVSTIQTSLNKKSQDLIVNEIDMLQKQLALKQTRISTLNENRASQEKRLNDVISTYNRRLINSLRDDISIANKDIKELSSETTALSNQINVKNTDLGKLQKEKFTIDAADQKVDVGPLRFLTKITKMEMKDIVNLLILVLIFVFDPLAVYLVLATNIIFKNEKGQQKKEPVKRKWTRRKPVDIIESKKVQVRW